MDIYSQNIYEVIENGNKKHILIIYNISENHYVGLTVHSTKLDSLTYIKSIDRFIDINDLQEYSKRNINGLVYVKGKFLKVSSKDFSNILKLLKNL